MHGHLTLFLLGVLQNHDMLVHILVKNCATFLQKRKILTDYQKAMEHRKF